MKVLQVTPFYAPHTGGVETHLTQLNKQLIDRGYQLSVLTVAHDAQLPLEEHQDGVHIHRMAIETPYFQKQLYKINIWTAILQHVKVIREADIIQVHDVLWWLLPLWPLIGHKTYLVFHGWEGVYPISWTVKLQRWVWAHLARRTIHVGTYLQQFYWDKPDRIFFGAVDDRFVKTPALPRKTKPVHLVYLGRLVAENEIEKYLTLVKLLKVKNPSLTVTWVGDGPYKNQCAKVGKTTGFVTDVLPYLDEADVVLATSYLSTMQAQARGKIVCGLYSHPLKETTLRTFPTANAMLISSDPAQMAEWIISLLGNPSLKHQYEQQAQRWARAQTWEHIADEYEKLWGTYG